jgi:hypothetical protein
MTVRADAGRDARWPSSSRRAGTEATLWAPSALPATAVRRLLHSEIT